MPVSALFDPPRFQSAGKTGNWFEGWYFKMVDASRKHQLAVIPGVSHDAAGGTSHAFVQLIRPGGHVRYIRMPFEQFTWSADRFEIAIGLNRFSSHGLTLDLPETADGPPVTGEITFGALWPWPVTLASPGIMGWYRYVPFMECYHGVVSMDHTLSGSLRWGNDEPLDFSLGRGYAEKDWGSGFPSSWIWTQCNHFADTDGHERQGVSLSLSVARIPWLGSSFTGHIAGLLIDGRLHRFATYTGSRLTRIETGDGSAQVTLEDRHLRLHVEVDGAGTGSLKAPAQGAMTARADEALDARVQMTLSTRDGETLFSGTGEQAGVEIMNSRDELMAARATSRAGRLVATSWQSDA